MADRIFMAVPRVPWHCEHNVDKKECDTCGRPDDDSGSSRRGTARGDGHGSDRPGSDRDGGTGPGGAAERYPTGSDSTRTPDWLADAILRSAAFND